jgi:hypothetical protein
MDIYSRILLILLLNLVLARLCFASFRKLFLVITSRLRANYWNTLNVIIRTFLGRAQTFQYASTIANTNSESQFLVFNTGSNECAVR